MSQKCTILYASSTYDMAEKLNRDTLVRGWELAGPVSAYWVPRFDRTEPHLELVATLIDVSGRRWWKPWTW